MNNLPQSLINEAKNYKLYDTEKRVKLIKLLYCDNGLTWKQVADLVQESHANTVRRFAVKYGIKSRDKSEAQTLAIAVGNHPHPTKGKTTSKETKEKISESVAKAWQNASDEEKEKRKQQAKERWAAKTPEEQNAIRELAFEAIRKAASEGSELEKFLLESLIASGYKVEFHKEHLVAREKLQVDLFLPEQNVAIEVDGPSHWSNIWGQEALDKNIQRDREKSGILLGRGLCVVRIRHKKSPSQKDRRDILSKLLDTIKNIEDKFPPLGERHIILGEI